MIEFTTLYIDPTGSKLTIKANVKDLQYYTNIYIDKVIIDDQNTYIDGNYSSTPVFSKTISGDNKSIILEIEQTELLVPLINSMFFVYIKTKGNVPINIPCGLDNQTTMCPVYNQYPVYKYLYSYLKEINHTCDIPKEFINAYLQYQTIDISLKTNHYVSVCKYWKKFFMNNVINLPIFKKCNCNE